jgi:hypothetical protein
MIRMNENEVVDATIVSLRSSGWDIESFCHTNERGTDIVARAKDGVRAHIEAKGNVSSNPTSANYVSGMNGNQAGIQVGQAIFTAMKLRSKYPQDIVGVAFPNDSRMRSLVDAVNPCLVNTKIAVLWVNEDKTLLMERL